MRAVYAESSAVLAWLLGEPSGEAVRRELAGAETVVASALTVVECDRALWRSTLVARVSEADRDRRRRTIEPVDPDRGSIVRIHR